MWTVWMMIINLKLWLAIYDPALSWEIPSLAQIHKISRTQEFIFFFSLFTVAWNFSLNNLFLLTTNCLFCYVQTYNILGLLMLS